METTIQCPNGVVPGIAVADIFAPIARDGVAMVEIHPRLSKVLLALALLILRQLVVTFWSVRSTGFAKTIRCEPALLPSDERTMKRKRIIRDEAMSAVRAGGGSEIGRVKPLFSKATGP